MWHTGYPDPVRQFRGVLAGVLLECRPRAGLGPRGQLLFGTPRTLVSPRLVGLDERSAGHIRDWRHCPLLRSRLMERSAKCQRPNRTKMVIFSFVFARASPDPSLATVQYKVRAWNCRYT